MRNARNYCWYNYFGTKSKVIQTRDGTSFSNTIGSSNYYVFVCTFEECKEKGAIYIQRSNEICVLLEDNTFTRCKSTTDGGSVCYNCRESGQFVQQRNSYIESISAYRCMSFFQLSSPSSTSKNYAFQVSVTKCGESESNGYYTFHIAWGDLRFENNNITYNKCIYYSSISSWLGGKSVTCGFSTFRENNQTGSESLVFYSNSDSYIQTVSYCNVIGNKCGTDDDQVLFLCRFNTTVDHCVFLNNTAKYMFWIFFEDCTLTITDSCIQSNSKTGSGTLKLIIENISQFDSFDCFKEPKLMTVKVSNFCSFAEFSNVLFTKK